MTHSNSGWLSNTRHCYSPNFDARPDAQDISLIVVHNISLPPAEFGNENVESFFCNCLEPSAHPYFETIADMRVSAHFFIQRTGELTQFVSCDDMAWHAGVSNYQGRERCNDFSIGIELEGTDELPYTHAQYSQLAKLCARLIAQYPKLSASAICGHSDIAPGRKTDPGSAFDWPLVKSMLKVHL